MNRAPTDDFDHYGQSASSRIPEISAVSAWMSNWASTANRFHHNLILLRDFNIDRSGSPLWQALTASGLTLPKELETVKRSIFIKDGDDPRPVPWNRNRFCKSRGYFVHWQGAKRANTLPYSTDEQRGQGAKESANCVINYGSRGRNKYYDQIVWFSDGAGKKALTLSYRNAGSFDFLPYLYREEEMSKRSVSYRISDHYPLWVEFGR